MIDIIGKRFWFFLGSGILIVVSIIGMSVFGLNLGVEFHSGSELIATFAPTVTKDQIIQALSDAGYSRSETVVRKAGSDYVIDIPQELSDAQQADLRAKLTAALGTFTDKGIQKVSASVAANTTRNTTIAVIISIVGMLLYISWAFRRMPNPLRWGTANVVALVHDAIVATGIWAIFAGILGWRVDLLFISALLTVIGYSDNDTVVVFDRIRENVRRYPGLDFETVVNQSLVETMGRSFNTVLTTLFAVIVLLLFVGPALQNFVIVLLVGITSGAYSSVFIASPLLVVWHKREWGRFIGRKPAVARQPAGR